METTGSHCCICTGVCAHTGGVQYCEMHNPNRREINNFDAPYAICFHCAKKDQRIDELESFLAEDFVNEFAKTNGGHQVHASWRDNMLEQDREVSEERMKWETLDSKDRVLDALIAYDVIDDFVKYILAHPHEALAVQQSEKE